jgi:hypothetical protein
MEDKKHGSVCRNKGDRGDRNNNSDTRRVARQRQPAGAQESRRSLLAGGEGISLKDFLKKPMMHGLGEKSAPSTPSTKKRSTLNQKVLGWPTSVFRG